VAAVSGQYGKIMLGSSNLVECTGWTWDRNVASHAYASCATAGYKKRVAGTKDSTGTASGIYDPADQIDDLIDIGDLVSLLLYVTAIKYYTVPSLVVSVGLEVDVEEGEIIRWELGFEGNGSWTEAS